MKTSFLSIKYQYGCSLTSFIALECDCDCVRVATSGRGIAIYRKSTERQVVNAEEGSKRGGGQSRADASQQSLPQLISLDSSSYTFRDPH